MAWSCKFWSPWQLSSCLEPIHWSDQCAPLWSRRSIHIQISSYMFTHHTHLTPLDFVLGSHMPERSQWLMMLRHKHIWIFCQRWRTILWLRTFSTPTRETKLTCMKTAGTSRDGTIPAYRECVRHAACDLNINKDSRVWSMQLFETDGKYGKWHCFRMQRLGNRFVIYFWPYTKFKLV